MAGTFMNTVAFMSGGNIYKRREKETKKELAKT